MVETRNKTKKSTAQYLDKEQPKPVEDKPITTKPTITDLKVKRKNLNEAGNENIEVREYMYNNVNRSVNDINKFVQGIAKKLTDKGLDFKINTSLYTPLNWKSGRITQGNHSIQMWTPNWGTNEGNANDNLHEWYDNGKGNVEKFSIFVQTLQPIGGHDDHNDCLYNTLKTLLKETLTNKWDYPWKLKKSLNIARDDKVNCKDHIDMIERILNIGIFIEGDFIRLPKIDTKTSITITLQDGHYSPKRERKTHESITRFSEKKPLFYNLNKKTNIYTFYDGTTIQSEPRHSFLPKVQYRTKTDYYYIKCANNADLINEYNLYTYNADQLKQITHGRINLYKTQTIKETALKLFYEQIQHIPDPEKIDDAEAEFILNCYRGGLLFGEKYKGPAYKGDVCSMYPSIMLSKIMFPAKKGEFKTITNEQLCTKNKQGEVYFKTGIYRAIITPTNKDKKLFHFNNLNYYTHTDLALAHKLNFNINIINDNTPNFLFYPPSACITGTTLFKNYITYLFDLKKAHPDLKYIKRILNILWGALSETNITNSYSVSTDKELIINNTERIVNIKKYNDAEFIFECEEVGNKFCSGFARISPFITAKGRSLIAQLAKEHVKDVDRIYRVHTDSILCSEPLHIKDKTDCDLGDFGLEHGEKQVEVVNMMKVIEL
jgi:hypothetical protein